MSDNAWGKPEKFKQVSKAWADNNQEHAINAKANIGRINVAMQ